MAYHHPSVYVEWKDMYDWLGKYPRLSYIGKSGKKNIKRGRKWFLHGKWKRVEAIKHTKSTHRDLHLKRLGAGEGKCLLQPWKFSKPGKFKLWNRDISNKIPPFILQITVLGNKLINGLRTSPVPAGTGWVVASVVSQALADTFFFFFSRSSAQPNCWLSAGQ